MFRLILLLLLAIIIITTSITPVAAQYKYVSLANYGKACSQLAKSTLNGKMQYWVVCAAPNADDVVVVGLDSAMTIQSTLNVATTIQQEYGSCLAADGNQQLYVGGSAKVLPTSQLDGFISKVAAGGGGTPSWTTFTQQLSVTDELNNCTLSTTGGNLWAINERTSLVSPDATRHLNRYSTAGGSLQSSTTISGLRSINGMFVSGDIVVMYGSITFGTSYRPGFQIFNSQGVMTRFVNASTTSAEFTAGTLSTDGFFLAAYDTTNNDSTLYSYDFSGILIKTTSYFLTGLEDVHVAQMLYHANTKIVWALVAGDGRPTRLISFSTDRNYQLENVIIGPLLNTPKPKSIIHDTTNNQLVILMNDRNQQSHVLRVYLNPDGWITLRPTTTQLVVAICILVSLVLCCCLCCIKCCCSRKGEKTAQSAFVASGDKALALQPKTSAPDNYIPLSSASNV